MTFLKKLDLNVWATCGLASVASYGFGIMVLPYCAETFVFCFLVAGWCGVGCVVCWLLVVGSYYFHLKRRRNQSHQISLASFL